MEDAVFPEPAVAEALSNYVEARIHTDEKEPRAFQRELTGTIAQPTFVILDPTTRTVIRQSGPMLSVQAALDFLLPVPR